MDASAGKAIVTGLPHSGKTSRLIELFLDSLKERPDERRVMIVPDSSHRDYLRTVIIKRGECRALRETEVVTLAEFLRGLAEAAGLLTGRRMTSLEELLAIRRMIRALNEAGEAQLPLTLATCQRMKHMIEALRNAGLYLRLLDRDAAPTLPGRRAVALKLAVRYLEAMKSAQRYDGLLAQELAVLALRQGRCGELLPELILVDGFYDLQTDPIERHNLINVPAYREQIEAMKKQLFDELEAGGGLVIPVRRPRGERLDQRKNRR